jgi:hypothetical protein
MAALDCYLSRVLDEARGRGYQFDASKIRYRRCHHGVAEVTTGQLAYEWAHLLAKLSVRDPSRRRVARQGLVEPHECFLVVPGPIAEWERILRI